MSKSIDAKMPPLSQEDRVAAFILPLEDDHNKRCLDHISAPYYEAEYSKHVKGLYSCTRTYHIDSLHIHHCKGHYRPYGAWNTDEGTFSQLDLVEEASCPAQEK